MKKQLLVVLLMFLSVIASAEEVEINGLWYNLVPKAKIAEVIQYKNEQKYKGDVVIPDAVTYEGINYSVTSIGGAAFRECFDLTSITIPNSITNIGGSAFWVCMNLTSVTIPHSVTTIGEGAFYGCSGLASVTIPNSVTSIGSLTFCGCSGLTSVIIGNSVASIASGAFQDCTSLASVHISDLFAWCNISFSGAWSNPLQYAHHLYLNGEEIKDLVIPTSVTSIGKLAFSGCSGITSVFIPNSVIQIGADAFGNCI